MRQEWNLIDRLELGCGACHCLVGIADALRDRGRTKRCLLKFLRYVVGREISVLTVVPFDLQCRKALLGGAHVIGHDRDRVVEPHDLAHALDGLCRRLIEALHASAGHRRLRERCDLHAGRARVDAIDRSAVDLCGGIEPLGRRADQLELVWRFQRDTSCRWHFRSVVGELAICQLTSGRHMDHLAVLRAAGFCIDAPAIGGGRDQHGPRGSTSLAQRLPCAAHRIGIAGRLHAQQGIDVELFVRRRVLEPHLLEIHFELFGDQHRDRGIGALPHLHIGHRQHHLPIAADADEGVRRKTFGRGRLAAAERQAEAQHETAADGGAGRKKAAT